VLIAGVLCFSGPRLEQAASRVRDASKKQRRKIRLFIMAPHPDHFDHGIGFKHLVNQSMLDVDSPRISAAQVTNQLLVRWRILGRLFRQNGEQRLCFRFQPGARQLLCIF
jgi:hypothetical protein